MHSLVAVDSAIWQHNRRVMFIHQLASHGADKLAVYVLGAGDALRQLLICLHPSTASASVASLGRLCTVIESRQSITICKRTEEHKRHEQQKRQCLQFSSVYLQGDDDMCASTKDELACECNGSSMEVAAGELVAGFKAESPACK